MNNLAEEAKMGNDPLSRNNSFGNTRNNSMAHKLSVSQIQSESSNDEDAEEEASENVEDIYKQAVHSQLQNEISKGLQYNLLRLRMMNKRDSQLLGQKVKAIEAITQPLMDQQIMVYKPHQAAIISIQAFIRMRVQKRQYKQRIKRARYRLNVIKELLNTEETYVKDLGNLWTQVLLPLTESMPRFQLDKSTATILLEMVRSLEKIKDTNQEILIVFQIRMQTLAFNCSFFKDFDTCYIQQFSTYFTFCQKFQVYVEAVALARKVNPGLNEIIVKAERSPCKTIPQKHLEFRGLDFSSMFVKPVQRLPKYILLLKDLLKHTEESHIDYINIKRCIAKFEQVNEKNNSEMNKYIHESKLKELDSLIKQSEKRIDIVIPGREFLMEESLTVQFSSYELQVLSDEAEKSVIVYFLSDLVLITEVEGNETKLWKSLEIDELSICKNTPDQKYFSYLISLKGKNSSVTFICQSKENKKNILSQLQAYLKEIRQRAMRKMQGTTQNQDLEKSNVTGTIPVQVSTLGTEVRTIGEHYTVYIVEVVIEQIVKRLYLRYSEIRELRNMCEKDFGMVDLPKLSNTNFLNKQKTKVVEKRKVLIEDVLQMILNNSRIQAEGATVLKFIGLPIDLFRTLQKRSETEVHVDRLSKLNHTETDTFTHNRPSAISLSQKDDIRGKSSTIQLLMARQAMEDTTTTPKSKFQKMASIQSKGYSTSIVQVLLADGQLLEMEVDELTTGKERIQPQYMVIVIHEVGQKIGLRNSLDFKLYMMEKKSILRCLDNDILIQRFVQEMHKSGLKFQRLQLYFRKYIFLLNKLEQEDFNQEPVRLRLIVFQILEEIKEFKYNLKFLQFILMACVGVYLKRPQLFPLKDAAKLPFELVATLVPEKQLLAHQKHVWVINMMNCFEMLNKEIQEFVDKKKKESRVCDVPEIVNFTLYVVVMQRIREHHMYGITTFPVEVYKQTIKDIKSVHKETMPSHMLLGVSITGIGLYTPDSNLQRRKYTYEQIKEVKVFPLSLIFTLADDVVNYRFNSHQSFHINQLIEEYRYLMELMKELQFHQ